MYISINPKIVITKRKHHFNGMIYSAREFVVIVRHCRAATPDV